MRQTFPRRTFDDQFDCVPPSDAFKAYRKSAPPPPPSRKVVHTPPASAKREWRGALIIGTIAIVALLYAVSHQRAPSLPALPTESRSVPVPVPAPSSVEVRRALSVEVRRALPAVPRALPVTSAVSPVANWQQIRFLDGTTVWASYQGELSSSAALPPQGRFIGEEWSTGNTSWIWMTPPGASFPSWVDP
jgi:hypothetical protein